MDTLETTQILFVGCNGCDKLVRVKLDHLIAFAAASVCNIDAHRDDSAQRGTTDGSTGKCCSFLVSDLQVSIAKRRVTQAVPKIVERAIDTSLLTLPLCVRLGWKVERDLSYGFWKRNGQPAARIV